MRPPCLVISIGNLCVGGTGKSVVTQFLVELFYDKRVAIITRGYGRKSVATFLLSDGKKLLAPVEQAGDEAVMLASMTSASVAVGNNRADAWLCIKNNDDVVFKQTEVLILDDGYQNNNLVKDLEIVLVDALQPFANNHCLPAGSLREKSLSRASIVLLTRSDRVKSEDKVRIKNLLSAAGYTGEYYFTRHVVRGVFLRNSGNDVREELKGMSCLVMAGIGNFSAFSSQMTTLGCCIVEQLEYRDHYAYTDIDIQLLHQYIQQKTVKGIVVTAKDWYKLVVLKGALELPLYVVQVGIEFLSPEEYHKFAGTLQRRLGASTRIF